MSCLLVILVTALCFRFLLKLKWPKNKNNYGAPLSHIYIKEYLTCQLSFFSGIKACVYREKRSESWDISRYITRNRCITSINAGLGKHAFVTVEFLPTFTFNTCFLKNTTLTGVLKFLNAYSIKLYLCFLQYITLSTLLLPLQVMYLVFWCKICIDLRKSWKSCLITRGFGIY